MKRKKININNIILQYVDEENVIHEVDLSNILDSGVPIDENGIEMTYLTTYIIEE